MSTVNTNAQRRALILAQVEARLQEVWPDEQPAPQRTFADFDELEATAARTGDALAQALMAAGLQQALTLPAAPRPATCPDCGRALQWESKPRTVQTIRGPVGLQRDYGYCRACRRGFFPRGTKLSLTAAPAERPVPPSVV